MRIKNILRRKKYAKGGVGTNKPPEYIEKDTKCDLCSNLGDCIDEGIVINVQSVCDIKPHYETGLDSKCMKDPVVQLQNAYYEYKEYYQKINSAFESLSEGINWKEFDSICDGYKGAHDRLMGALEQLLGG